jgi:hypothetical protein
MNHISMGIMDIMCPVHEKIGEIKLVCSLHTNWCADCINKSSSIRSYSRETDEEQSMEIMGTIENSGN